MCLSDSYLLQTGSLAKQPIDPRVPQVRSEVQMTTSLFSGDTGRLPKNNKCYTLDSGMGVSWYPRLAACLRKRISARLFAR